jgi:hypothetical protein
LLLELSWTSMGHGTPGDLDPTFGSGGIAVGLGPKDLVSAMVQQPEGKLVVAGTSDPALANHCTPTAFLVHYHADGRVDRSFGTEGTMTIGCRGSALLQKPDGKLVLASARVAFPASHNFDILLTRYQPLGCPAAYPDPCLASLAAFVTEVYRAAFVRQPDAVEEAYRVEVLASEPSPDTGRGMLHVVFDGPEFRQRLVNP